MRLTETTGPTPTCLMSTTVREIDLNLPPEGSQFGRAITMTFLGIWIIRFSPKTWSILWALSTRIVRFSIKVGRVWLTISTWVIRFPQVVWVGTDSGTSVTDISSGAWQFGTGPGTRIIRAAPSSRVVWFFQGSQITYIGSGTFIVCAPSDSCKTRMALKAGVVRLWGWFWAVGIALEVIIVWLR